MDAKRVKRLFAFGCSFTRYGWTTWPQILAEDLDVPYWNYGGIGAGNQYIFNTMVQADSYYNFTEDDLVVMCWTNVCREDRYVGSDWLLPGNIFTQSNYDKDWVEKFCDPNGMALRDYATIKAADVYLQQRGCQFEFLSMLDLTTIFDQYNYNWLESIFNTQAHKMAIELKELFGESLSKIKPSFYEVLWDNDINYKVGTLTCQFNNFSDSHPTPKEHLIYMQKVLDHTFSDATIAKVDAAQATWTKILSDWDKDPNRDPAYPHKKLYADTLIREKMFAKGYMGT